MRPHEVFLLHSSEDRAIAERIAALLRDHGIPTFYAPANILGHQQWQDEIIIALQRCDWFAVLVTPAAIQSMWVKREVAIALSERRYEKRIVPLNYRDCDLPDGFGWLRTYQFVDFRADISDGARDLLRVWGLGLKS